MSIAHHKRLLCIVIALGAFLVACGDDGPSRNFLSKDQLPGRSVQPAVQAEAKVIEPEVPSSGAKDQVAQWPVIAKHFMSFAEASGAFKDPFQPQIIRYAGRDELLQKIRNLQPESGQEVLVDTQVSGPKGPLQLHALAKYTPVIILTDADESKVVVETPSGEAHVVTKGTHVGVEGGIVQDITQYAVVYTVPGRTEYVIRSIKPQLLEKMNVGPSSILGIHSDRR
jgi:hypothetical protein